MTPPQLTVSAVLAWAERGIHPNQVPNGEFKFTKLSSAGESGYFSWGFLEFEADDIKRSKNSRRMHMVFHVVQGAAEVNVNDNLFTVHRGGVWQVPRGEFDCFTSFACSSLLSSWFPFLLLHPRMPSLLHSILACTPVSSPACLEPAARQADSKPQPSHWWREKSERLRLDMASVSKWEYQCDVKVQWLSFLPNYESLPCSVT